MKIKEGFILRNVDGTYLVVAVGDASQRFNGLITLNESGALLWKRLSEGATAQQLCDVLCETFTVDAATAAADVEAFLETARTAGLLDE